MTFHPKFLQTVLGLVVLTLFCSNISPASAYRSRYLSDTNNFCYYGDLPAFNRCLTKLQQSVVNQQTPVEQLCQTAETAFLAFSVCGLNACKCSCTKAKDELQLTLDFFQRLVNSEILSQVGDEDSSVFCNFGEVSCEIDPETDDNSTEYEYEDDWNNTNTTEPDTGNEYEYEDDWNNTNTTEPDTGNEYEYEDDWNITNSSEYEDDFEFYQGVSSANKQSLNVVFCFLALVTTFVATFVI